MWIENILNSIEVIVLLLSSLELGINSEPILELLGLMVNDINQTFMPARADF